MLIPRKPCTTEYGYDAHHLRSTDGFAQPALCFRGEASLSAVLNFSHFGDKRAHEDIIGSLL